MKTNKMKLSIITFSLLLSSHVLAEPPVASAEGAGLAVSGLATLSDSQRIQRLEKILNSDLLREQTQTIQTLREEISALREQIELQEYEQENLKQRQRNLYLDMDRRISGVEAGKRSSGFSVLPVPPPNLNAKATQTTPKAGAGDGQPEYAKAFALLKEGQYGQSIKAFETFKTNFPDSKYADNAQYWLAEANYVSREYKKALKEFQQLISQYPSSSKNPGAHLKIGYVYFELKNWSAARDALQKVINLYPDSTVAKKANERLQRMKREGK